MNILIIDDDERFSKTLVEELQDFGHEAIAFNSYEKFKSSQDNKFTHAVIDLRLKNENGLDIVKNLRAQFENIKIIMLTGYGSIATAVTAVKNGADDYLSKPIEIEILLATLEGKNHMTEDNSSNEMSLARHEREYIEMILEKCEGNISKAARVLGLHRQSLQRMLKKYPTKE